MKYLTVAVVLLASLSMVACGSSRNDRVLSGGAIGAGVGTVGAAAVGGSLATGAIVGGAVGAATGAVTNEDEINLD